MSLCLSKNEQSVVQLFLNLMNLLWPDLLKLVDLVFMTCFLFLESTLNLKKKNRFITVQPFFPHIRELSDFIGYNLLLNKYINI
jgi:hypothetical protein